MSVKMNPISVIQARIGIAPNGSFQRYATQRMATYMDKYVPYDDGTLRNNIEIGIDYVLYKSEYAHYQYNGILYVDPETGSSFAGKDVTKVPTEKQLNYHTEGTGSFWDKKMLTAEGEKYFKELEKYANGGR